MEVEEWVFEAENCLPCQSSLPLIRGPWVVEGEAEAALEFGIGVVGHHPSAVGEEEREEAECGTRT